MTGTPKPATRPKTAVLAVDRQNDGIGSYSLLIDGVAQELSSSSLHWDDASPWKDDDYRLQYEPFHGRWPAWLVKRVEDRQAIKVHRGTRTDHSQGCIVLAQAKIDEILQILGENDVSRNDLRLSVRGVADFGFEIIAKSGQVVRGGKLEVAISLTGAMSVNGVSKDIWVHVNPDGTAALNVDFAPARPQRLPAYHSSSSYAVDGPGFWVKVPEGQNSIVVVLDVKHNGTQRLPKTVKFLIDGYKIVNNTSRGPEFYTPSNYRKVLNRVRFNRGFVHIRPQ